MKIISTTSFVTVHCFGAYAPRTLPFTDCVFLQSGLCVITACAVYSPSTLQCTSLNKVFVSFWHHSLCGLQIPSNVTVHMPFQEHISFWLDSVKLYTISISHQTLEVMPSCVRKGGLAEWWHILFCTKRWWIHGHWMPWWQHLTCWCFDWRRYFSLMKMPLSPKRPAAIPIRQLRESTLFSCRPSTSRLMEMLLY